MDAYDLATLFSFRATLRSTSDQPALRFPSAPPPPVRRVAILPGSFNPPTSAHLLLAERALGDAFDLVVFVLSARPAEKSAAGLMPEDRLLAVRAASPAGAAIGVAVAGLCVDQAEAACEAFDGAEVSVLVGSDKLAQILEPGWYADREAALDRLFACARLLVAPRGDGPDAVERILSATAPRRWVERVSVLPLHPAVGDLSSTRVRGLLGSGADPAGLVAPAVAAILAETRAFAGPDPENGIDHYATRVTVFDALWDARDWAVANADFRALCKVASSPTRDGAALRERLRAGSAGADDLDRAQAAAV